MKSVGEAMAIGRTFKQAFAKALRSRELDSRPAFPDDDAALLALTQRAGRRALRPRARGAAARARRSRSSTELTQIDPGSCASWRRSPPIPRRRSRASGRFKSVDTCAAEFAATTPYFYSAWERPRPSARTGRCRRTRSSAATRPSVVILGSGPNRIGQGIEFDYCCVHAAQTVRESGRDAVMINCNPETVSTDYDTSDRLYFEPLTLEDVLGVCEVEQPEGVIVQFGGQTPLKLAARAARRRDPDPRDQRPTRSTWPRTARASGRCSTRSATRRRRTRRPARRRRRSSARPRSASRCSCGPATCSAAARWRSSTASTGCSDYLERVGVIGIAGSDRPEPDDLPRPLPRGLGRGRRRRALRRRGRLDRGDHAARRGGRDPLRRLGLRAAAALARRGDARPDPRADGRDRQGARRRRAAERPVRDPRQRGPARDRGQPARLAHGAVRLQGDRAAGRQARLPDHARGEARATWICRPRSPPATSASRRRCCRSTASPAPTCCSARRCARPAR